ncbi:MAG: terminase [Bacteroidales bacterium]|jgi:hypothetical protein|nr:terminase [Bacteroidales bacterium]
MTTKKETQRKKELARLYYMQGESQKSIAEKIESTEATVSRWSKAEGWEAKRAGTNITRPELVNKLLVTINTMIDSVHASNDPMLIGGLADKLSKFAAVIEKLDKKANVVDAIEVFMAFNKWLEYRMSYDKDVTPELIKAINKYQDLYISENIVK